MFLPLASVAGVVAAVVITAANAADEAKHDNM